MKKSLLIGTVVLGCLWARAGEIALTNPSFEKGTGGYWISKPALASIDSTDSSNGKQSLCIAGDSENRVDVVFFVAHEPEMVYELTFDVKGEGKADGPPVRVALMLQGQKPIAFWQPKGEEAKPFEPFSPAVDWQKQTLRFGPVPAEFHGKQVQKIGIFLKTEKGVSPGNVWFDNIALSTAKAPEQPTPKKK